MANQDQILDTSEIEADCACNYDIQGVIVLCQAHYEAKKVQDAEVWDTANTYQVI